MPSPNTSPTDKSERYGLIAEVHFTVNRNKRGWFITEFNALGSPFKTHGPLEGPLTKLDAMSYLIANHTLNQ